MGYIIIVSHNLWLNFQDHEYIQAAKKRGIEVAGMKEANRLTHRGRGDPGVRVGHHCQLKGFYK